MPGLSFLISRASTFVLSNRPEGKTNVNSLVSGAYKGQILAKKDVFGEREGRKQRD